MKKFMYVVILLALLTVSFLIGSWYSQREPVKVNPSVVKSPAVNADPKPDTDTSSLYSGTVKISPEKQQAIGVRVAVVEKKPVKQTLRILGKVSVDETRVYRLNSAVDGWIKEIFPNTVGSLVKKGQPLIAYYAPEFLSAQQAYFYALGALDRLEEFKQTPEQIAHIKANIQLAADNLRNLGMDEIQIGELERSKQVAQRVVLRTPVTGFIISRNIFPGQRFERGTEFYRIADLSNIWILADLFENEAQYLQPAKTVKVSLPHQKKTFQAKVSNVLPQFDPATRTLKVRLEADNPGYILKPDMFVDVELPVTLPPAIAVPADAVLDSGLKKTVFVDLGNGYFEPREVETGWRLGNRVEIVKGLNPGEKIVISGNFMIDSESRMEMVTAGMYGTLSKDPVCGVEVSINKAEKTGRKSIYKGKAYYFISGECKEQFEKNPDRYVK